MISTPKPICNTRKYGYNHFNQILMCLTNDEEKSAKNRNGMTKYERVIITLKFLVIYGTIVVISYDNYLTTSINISVYHTAHSSKNSYLFSMLIVYTRVITRNAVFRKKLYFLEDVF